MNSKIMAAALFAAFGITSAYAAPQYGDTPSATRGAVRDLITESDSVNVTFKNGVTQQRGVLTISKYMIVTTYVRDTETYNVLVCDENDNGKGDWKGFYNVRKEDKAAALDKAIKGVGPVTSKCIVANGLLSSKPRSWNAFKIVMRNADDVCGGGIYYNTVVKYGGENAQNLGYAGANCQTVSVTEPVLKAVEQKELVARYQQDFTVTVEGAKFLPDESDKIAVSADENGLHAISNSFSPRNHYDTISTGRQIVELKATRIMKTPDAPAYQALGGSRIAVADKQFFAGFDKKARTELTVTIEKSFLGMGGKDVGIKTVVMTNGKAMVDVADMLGEIKAGKKYIVKLALRKLGSEYFNASYSPNTRTSALQK